MRLRNVKNAREIVDNSPFVVHEPKEFKGRYNEVFGNNNPIELEIGMGKGNFIIDKAMKNPDINFIGVERYESVLCRALEKLEDKQLPNVKIICIDAIELDEVFDKEISTIYLTFSEPWPKAHDEKKRFTHEGYLRLYDKIFKKNKRIILKTDNKGLFQYSLQSLSQYWYVFDKVSLDLHNDENPVKGNIMTDWEKKCVQDRKPIYYVDASFNG